MIFVLAGPTGRSPAEIVGSNPTGGMDVCLYIYIYIYIWFAKTVYGGKCGTRTGFSRVLPLSLSVSFYRNPISTFTPFIDVR